ncbi:ORF6N domain-containing protein [Paenibacillus wynnii]|uniref:KilA-N DNA-binding domain-containing protein n=1 Tax=Paenibacillus wynnii TaxID=268407 RepID=A0A098MDE5_9BACL|nr:ORF6N domain-containing protein [Paenibacillus wynnii]KGE20584.1 hypothetical protein PWYN_15450 [Paenibacillus wynnii]
MTVITPIEHSGFRVIMTTDLAASLGTETKIISKNFERNEHRYQLGKHFFILQGDELREFKASRQIDDNLKFAPVIYLWTEKGAWMHAKSLNTDEAWEAYEALVDDYYRIKSASVNMSQFSPQLQLLIQMEQGIKEIEQRQDNTDRQLAIVKETFLDRDEDWRVKMKGLLNGATARRGMSHRDMRTLSYQMLEERARCDLSRRLSNLKERLKDSGTTKSKVEEANRLDVIESEPRLKEIYTIIVKELSIGAMN